MFIAIGYHNLNNFRKEKFLQAIKLGYQLESYVGSNVFEKFKIGRNSFVMDGSVIQPYVSIGDNSFIWSGSMIGHHVKISNHCWITGSVNIGGLSEIYDECFLGLNATVSNNVIIGKRSLLGACTFVNKNLPEKSVVIEPGSNLFRLNSDNFLKISNSF
jgi:UDP-3-O-[3-hydroxymyristoyl] glucosamine N-acyltransferase